MSNKRINRYSAIPEVRDDPQSVANAVRAIKQTVDVMSRQAGNRDDWSVTLGELDAFGNEVVTTAINKFSLNDQVLDGILNRAADTADRLVQQARDEARIAFGSLQTALDNFKNGYADDGAVVRAELKRLDAVVADNEAAITSEKLVRATATQALAGQIDTVSAQTQGGLAAVTNEIIALSGPGGAIAAQINAVTTTSTGARTFVQTTAPVSLAVNAYWVDISSTTPVVKQWTGTVWNTLASTTSYTAPTSPVTGALWYDLATGVLKRWTGSAWTVQAAFIQSKTPTVIATGDLWLDTSQANSLKQWTGTAWVAVDNVSTLGVLLSTLTTESISKTDGDRTTAVRVNNLVSVAPDGNSASIAGTQVTTATRTSALASDLTQLQVDTTGGSAGGFYRLLASSSPGDGAAAEFQVQVRAAESGTGSTYSTSGMRIQAFGDGTSRIKFNTNQFIVADSNNTVAPFQVIVGASTAIGSATPPDINALVWAGNQFVGAGANATVITSRNGDSWEYRSGLTTPFGATNAVYGLAYNGTTLVAVGALGRIATSTDGGVTWTSRGTWGTTANIRAVIWANSQFVAVGETGRIATSPDGVTWTGRGNWGSSTLIIRDIVWTGSVYFIVGDGGRIATSPDGITWTARTTLSATSWSTASARSVVWTGTTIIVVGDAGKCATTVVDPATGNLGITWTIQPGLASTSFGTNVAYKALWTGTQAVVVGGLGVTATSSDGVTWEGSDNLATQSAWGAQNVYAIASSGARLPQLVVAGVGARTATGSTGVTWAIRAGQLLANVAVSADNISGSADAKNQIANLGLMAYANQITAANAATFIGTAAIGNAFIANAAITRAKIQDGEIVNAKIGSLEVDNAKIANLTLATEKVQANAISRTVYASANTGSFVSAGVGVTNYQVDARATLTTRQDTNGVKSRVFISTWSNGFKMTGDMSVYYAKMQVWSEAGGTSTLLAEVPLTSFTALGETGSGTYYSYTRGANATSFQIGLNDPPVGAFPILVRIEIQTIIASTSFFEILPQVNFQAWELSK